MANIKFSNLSGNGGNYINRLLLDEAIILPDHTTFVSNGMTSFVIQSREITMLAGQTVQFFAQGALADTDITATVSLFDITPLTADQITSMGNAITAAVLQAIADHDIIVKPTTVILGPCIKHGKSPIILGPCKEATVKSPRVLNRV